MGVLAWVMMGLAIWHFTVFVPDRFWGGIVGAFVGAIIGSVLFGLIVNGLAVPGRDDTHIGTALEAIPGAILGMGAVYLIGRRKEAGEAGEGRAEPSTSAVGV
jgi:hypothetical protein